jgi:hypothetical protein
MKLTCGQCGAEFIAQRPSVKFCSNRCRTAANREGRHVVPTSLKSQSHFDPANVDPLRVLASICSDPNQPAGPRVQAAIALHRFRTDSAEDNTPMAAVTRRALAIMTSGRAN